jgi:hypothetical protein
MIVFGPLNGNLLSALAWACPLRLSLDRLQQSAYNALAYDTFGDHLQTCQTKSTVSQVHDWVVYKLGSLLGSVGHRVKIHNITPATGKERGDLEIKDYVVLQIPQTQANRLPPPHTLILDYMVRIKIRHYRNVYLNHPDPIAFIPLATDTTVRLYDEFIRILFLHDHHEASVLTNELPEESDQFRFLRASCFANLKGAVGFIITKASVMRISIPLDLSSRSFIPFPRFIRSSRPTPLLAPSLILFPPSSD